MKIADLVFLSFWSCCLPGLVQATSLDDLYRDVIRSNNSGYLPLFVKNRHIPSGMPDDETMKKYVSRKFLALYYSKNYENF